MHETLPKVRLIAQTRVDWTEVARYLGDIDGMQWWKRMYAKDNNDAWKHDGSALAEFAGRLCYRSWKPGLNTNVTKVREDSADYHANTLASGHGSIYEHASYTFLFQDVSRVFTHELVRHRAGVAISQESLRYVRLTDIGFRIPDALLMPADGDPNAEAHNEMITDQIVELVETLEEFQLGMAKQFGLDDEGTPFHIKKEVTSALRRLAPLGLSTCILWTANLRTLRHVITMRTAAGAEEEIRDVFCIVAKMMRALEPAAFIDMEEQDDGSFSFIHGKV